MARRIHPKPSPPPPREDCLPMPFRPRAFDIPTAARQLVVAELVDAYRNQCELDLKGDLKLDPFKDFYESDLKPRNISNRFYHHYLMEWRDLKRLGPLEYKGTGERIADFAQAVALGRKSASAQEMVKVLTPRKSAVPYEKMVTLRANPGVKLYVCGAFDPTPATVALVTEGVQWMVDQGYTPTPIALRQQPGGAHRDAHARPPCGVQKWRFSGMYALVGIYPERTPCTIRHEVSHSIYHQLEKSDPDVIKKVKEIYKQAMAADVGLIFNDEYYMDVFPHAGHPMHNDGEFFAGAAHAYTHHAKRLDDHIKDDRTPEAVRKYALAMVQLLRERVFPRKK